MYILKGTEVSPYVLFGTVMGVSAPICVRNINYCLKHRSKLHVIKILKSAMAFFMILKSCMIIGLSASTESPNCVALGRTADIFYQLSMTFGDAVILERIQAVMLWRWGHLLILIVRLIIGMVDVPLAWIYLDLTSGVCTYEDHAVLGVIYTSMDAAIGLYATIITCYALIGAIRKLEQDRLIQVSKYYYITTVIRNAAPNFCLILTNLIGAIGNGSKIHNNYYMPLVDTLWPITNLLFVALIGYDIDLVKVIQNIHGRDKQQQRYLSDEALDPNRSPGPKS
ncbi:hypothetical protein BC941DRAFT_408444 [Chlamydoabsidia padenii]|nr:hypothetical protein BC941DRAFT_408444 [Chlamydoabsidia padenii]